MLRTLVLVVVTLSFVPLLAPVVRAQQPPAGANPLIVLNVKPGLGFLLDPMLLALGIVMLGVFLWSRLRPGSSWPSRWGL